MAGLPSGAGALVGQRLGKYDLLALLALGGTAEIYLARIDGTAGFEKYVVVKCLHDHLAEDPEFVSMFLDEARLGAQLDHSNIVQTLALGEHEGRYYMVMEYIAGLSLALVGRRAHERVRGGKVPVAIVLNVAAQACAGLHYAHERTEGGRSLGLVHRDVSPQNLVVTYEGIVKVVDFGIAKAEYRETRTRSGTVKGKFAYMSPEQCQAGDVDRRTDVFAVGVIVWELLTGRRLFKRDSTYETYQAVSACVVPTPSSINHELDPALDGLVMGALAKDRDRRYPTAEAFGEAMIGYLHHRGKPSGPGEIARFFDESFRQESEDQFARMRELIEGRQKSLADQKLLQWDASELDGSASVLDPDDLELIEESTSAPRPSQVAALAASGSVGPVSPPLASRAVTAPERPAGRTAAPSSPPPVAPPTGAMRAVGPVPETVPVRRVPADAPPAPPRADSEPSTIAVEDDFEAGQITDTEAELPDDSTRIEPADALAGLAARRPTTVPDEESAAARAATAADGRAGRAAREPTAPPRKASVITPPGMRAGGAPLDLMPHEREAMMAMATPPPTEVPPAAAPAPPRRSPTIPPATPPRRSPTIPPATPPRQTGPQPRQTGPQPVPARPAFVNTPTVLAPDVRPSPALAPATAPALAPAPSRFADVPTVHAAEAPRPRFADVPTVLAAPGGPAQVGAPLGADPPTGETQMLGAEDLIELAPTAGAGPGAAAAGAPAGPAVATAMAGAPPASMPMPMPMPAELIAVPSVEQVYPDQPRYHQIAAAPVPRAWPPWVLAVVFVVVLAVATGLTVAIARALS